jgi:uncharacterized protein (TIGR02246 family)
MESQKDLAEINKLYDNWRKAWLAFPDTTLMLSLFEKNLDGHLVYQAEENPGALTTYKEIESYWHNAHNLLEKVTDWTEQKKTVSFLAPDVAIVWVELMTAIKTTVLAEQLIGKIRCSIGVRKGEQGWKIVHYHESRQLMAEEKAGKWSFFVDLTIK